jgi:hypothetical protein
VYPDSSLLGPTSSNDSRGPSYAKRKKNLDGAKGVVLSFVETKCIHT